MILDLVYDFLVDLIPNAVKKYLSALIDKHIRNRAVRAAVKKFTFFMIAVLTILVVFAFAGLMITLGTKLFSPV